MPISRITRNSLVYANNIRQNIETRIFGLPLTSGSFYLQNSQSLYLQDLSGTYVLEYASPIALSYNSYYNKFIADRSTILIHYISKIVASFSLAIIIAYY